MPVIRSEAGIAKSVYGFFPHVKENGERDVYAFNFPLIVIRPPKAETVEGAEVPSPAESAGTTPEPQESTPEGEAAHTAEIILREAKKQADNIMNQAWKEAEIIQANAREKGYALGLDEGTKKGEADGFAKMKAEATPLMQALKTGLQKIGALEGEIRVVAEQQMCRLALRVAQKIIRREIEESSPVAANLREAVKRAVDLSRLNIRVHPNDLEQVQRYRPTLLAEVEGIKSVHIQADASIAQGGCVVETNFGDIDTRIEQQFLEIEKEIQEASRG